MIKKIFLFSIICLFATLSNAHLLCFSEYTNKSGDVITIEDIFDTAEESYITPSKDVSKPNPVVWKSKKGVPIVFKYSQKTGMQTANRWVIELIEPVTTVPVEIKKTMLGKTLWKVEVVGTTMAPAPYFDGNTQCGPEAHWVGINSPSWGDKTYTSYAWIDNNKVLNTEQ